MIDCRLPSEKVDARWEAKEINDMLEPALVTRMSQRVLATHTKIVAQPARIFDPKR